MNNPSFLTVCMNPSLQKTLGFSSLAKDRINRTDTYRLDASGKGVNVSRVLTQLGKTNCHVTQLGGSLRPLFLDLCTQDKLSVEWVESGSPIRFCYTLLDDADHSVTELVEESQRVTPGTEERLMAAYTRLLPAYEGVIISGTKAGGFSDALVPGMVRQAKEAGRQVILDLRGKDLVNSLRYKPDIIKPNLLEFIETFAPELKARLFVPEASDASQEERIRNPIRALCLELCQNYQCRIILTRGAHSIWFAESGGFAEYALEALQPVNTTGSGDAFTAGLAAALSEEADLEAAVAQGARCGRLNAGLFKVGVITEAQA
ncbi:MAG: PfkB family carbohydrate kinase [Treponema sp.]|jgi:1-phosphofructokinase/tagatose 6-phosphate kinase|nr:PfkB family carbohydrate kinase [Treponema sp.]